MPTRTGWTYLDDTAAFTGYQASDPPHNSTRGDTPAVSPGRRTERLAWR
jgi:hypothetical protein